MTNKMIIEEVFVKRIGKRFLGLSVEVNESTFKIFGK